MNINEAKVKLFSLLSKIDPNTISDDDCELMFLLSKDKAIQSRLDDSEKSINKE